MATRTTTSLGNTSAPKAIGMTRTLLLVILALLLPGCRSRPLQTIMRGSMLMSGAMDMTGDMKMAGDMNMDGDMRMAGDMNMTGDMSMSGQVSNVMKTDNQASRLASVPVYAASHAAPSISSVVVIDVDGIMVNKNIGGVGSMGENPVALFREKLDALSTDPNVGAIVLRINSQGGGVTAADIMTRDLMQVKSPTQNSCGGLPDGCRNRRGVLSG